MLLLASALGYLFIFAAVQHLSDGFALHKISSELAYSRARETPCFPSEKIKEILSQKFYYLEKGSQCYVFESEDGQHVLKFFRFSRYRLPWFAKHLLLPPFLSELQEQHLQKKEKKLYDLLTSCKLAYKELLEESGLVFLHLNKTSSLNQTVVLYDRLKRPFPIDIDQYEFLIQQKGEPTYSYLSKLIAAKEQNKAVKALQDLVDALTSRFQKKIGDRDAVIHKNMGFRNGKVQYFDVGQFYMDPKVQNPSVYKEEIKNIFRPLALWLKEKDPQLALQFEYVLNE
ncbi:MAG: hypothetical protein WAM28_02940 [Chlamydiales bacterium]